jgi:hypothetical protein
MVTPGLIDRLMLSQGSLNHSGMSLTYFWCHPSGLYNLLVI